MPRIENAMTLRETDIRRFLDLAQRFREWAAAFPRFSREWESDWEEWLLVYTVSEPILAASTDQLGTRVLDELLYMIAQDNELEHLKDLLEPNRELLFVMAERSFEAGGPDAR